MGNKRLSSRTTYFSSIFEYTKRRDIASAKAKALKPLITTDTKAKREYEKLRKSCDNMNAKLCSLRRAVKRMDLIKEYLVKVDAVFTEVSSYKMLNSNMSKSERKMFSKMFCKWCLENGVNGYYVRVYVGAKGLWTISRNRKTISKLIAKNTNERRVWLQLKEELLNRGLNK
jgi:hypothetical protein